MLAAGSPDGRMRQFAGRPGERTAARRPADCFAELRLPAAGRRAGTDRGARHQPAARRIRRPLDRPAVHQYAAADAIRTSPKWRRCGCPRTWCIRRDGGVTQYVEFTRARLACRAVELSRAARPATTSRSASSSKAPIRWPTRPRSTGRSPRSSPRSVPAYPGLSPDRDGRPQRHRAGPQDRSRAGVRLAARAPADRRAPIRHKPIGGIPAFHAT